jgi:hypothetical protein
MAINISDSFHAAAVVGAPVPGTPSYLTQSGFKGVPTDVAPGVFRLQFDDSSKIDPTAGVFQGTCSANPPCVVQVVPLSDDEIEVRTFDFAGAPLDDCTVSISVFRHKL